MKKQEKQKTFQNFNKQVKILTKNYKMLEPHYIRLLFEFCQYDAIKTYKILQVIKDMHIPVSFIKKLVDFPNQSDKYIQQKLSEYGKRFGNSKIDLFQYLNQNQETKKKIIDQFDILKFNFFEFIPKDVCATIMSFLDPFSFSQFAQVNRKIYANSKSDAMQFYFKNLCLKIFKNQKPQLPQNCRFTQIREYVLLHPAQFGPNIVNAVTNNLRYYVWKSQQNSFKIQTNYYKSFGNYRNIFIHAPRVHFNGVYVCKHKYVKLGEKGFNHSYTPIHVIYYYRYLRFFQDGSLLCCVTSNKLKNQQIAKRLCYEKLHNFDANNKQQLKIGQFMQYKDTVYMRLVRCNTVFNYQFKIQSNQSKISDQLMVISYTLQLVDQREIVQKLYQYKPYKQKMLFNYIRNQYIQAQNNPGLQAVGL